MSHGAGDTKYATPGSGEIRGGVIDDSERRMLRYWRTRAWSRVGVVILIVILIIVIAAVVATRHEERVLASETYLSPGDTRLVTPSTTLCQGTTLNNPSSTVSATIFLLHSKPLLGELNNFTVSKQFKISSQDYQFWSFYLYPGSTYTLSSCLESGSVYYYVIKGRSNLNSWLGDLYSSKLSFLHYSDQCNSVTNRTASQTFTSEDEYYFVFYNNYHLTSSIRMTLTFNRVGYLPRTGGVLDFCTAPPSSSCSLAIPYASDVTCLVETSPPSDGRWDANDVNVRATCDPRVWVYVVSVLVPLVGLAASVAGIIAVYCCCVRKMSVYRLATAPPPKASQPSPLSAQTSFVPTVQPTAEQKMAPPPPAPPSSPGQSSDQPPPPPYSASSDCPAIAMN